MLRLIGASGAAEPVFRRLGMYGFQPELEVYLLHALRARWPRLVVTHAENTDELKRVHQQLWLCAKQPPVDTLAPALWLDGIGTDSVPVCLAPSLWRLAAPITADRLLPGIECVLAASPDG